MIWLTILPFSLYGSCGLGTVPLSAIIGFLLLGAPRRGAGRGRRTEGLGAAVTAAAAGPAAASTAAARAARQAPSRAPPPPPPPAEPPARPLNCQTRAPAGSPTAPSCGHLNPDQTQPRRH
jgi:hypothetical protein